MAYGRYSLRLALKGKVVYIGTRLKLSDGKIKEVEINFDDGPKVNVKNLVPYDPIFNAIVPTEERSQIAATVAAYDFSQFGLIGDIGGGKGHLLQAILAASPTSKGVLFDLPHVIGSAAGTASDRLTLCPGDFFRDPFPTCDAYVLMEVIHDWPDEESRAILKAVRRAAPGDARLLLIEALMPNEPGPSSTKTLDILMLGLFGGSQRTGAEYQALLADSSFRLERIIDTGAGVSIVEASVV